MKRIGIDLGGTKTEIMLTEEDPTQIIERKRVPTNQEKGYDFILNQLAGLINDYQALCKDETPVVGMGIPGSISPTTGLVRNANTQCLIGHPLKADLENLVNNTVVVENDANCFAVAEALMGAGKGYRMVFGIIMGTGMGGGVVYDGKLIRGLTGNTGEWGHATIDVNGPKWWSGVNGAMEAYLSGTGFQRMYKEHTGQAKRLQEIYQDYQNGEQAAKEVFEKFLFYFGYGMANLINAFDPDVVVIGGGVSNLPLLYNEGIEAIKPYIFNDEMVTPIVPNKMGDSGGIFGAALAAGDPGAQ